MPNCRRSRRSRDKAKLRGSASRRLRFNTHTGLCLRVLGSFPLRYDSSVDFGTKPVLRTRSDLLTTTRTKPTRVLLLAKGKGYILYPSPVVFITNRLHPLARAVPM